MNTIHPNANGKRPVVCVQGLGFVGSAMAVAIANARDADGASLFDVVGIDLPTPMGRERIRALNEGRFPFVTTDEDLCRAAAAATATGNLTASEDPVRFAEADVLVVDVHLDAHTDAATATADFSTLRIAIRTVAAYMKPGALVIVETTVPPGTCSRVIAPELEAGLRARGLPADCYLLAHSYERVMPGKDYLASITNFWRVYAGHTSEAADACERFLGQVVNVQRYPLTRLQSTTASELAKVMENSYRATNIAFIEEWARFAEVIGVDLFEVVDAIRVRPTHSNIRQPGFGVGGYCLTKDPLFPGIAAREIFDRPDLSFPFSEEAVRVNARMPLVTVDLLERALGGSLYGKRILLMGIAYRPDVADTRCSPSEVFVVEARRRGAIVAVHDPLVQYWEELSLVVDSRLPTPCELDAIVLAVPHVDYQQMDLVGWLQGARPLFVDANRVLSAAQRVALEAVGCQVRAVGRG